MVASSWLAWCLASRAWQWQVSCNWVCPCQPIALFCIGPAGVASKWPWALARAFTKPAASRCPADGATERLVLAALRQDSGAAVADGLRSNERRNGLLFDLRSTWLLCLGLVVPDGCSFPHNWGPWKVCRVSHLATSRALDTQHCCTLLCSLFKPALSRIGEALVLLQHNQDDLNWLALSFASCCSQHTEITAISRTKLWTLWLAIATRIMIMLQGYANC